jgi:hypothetical protein
MPGECGEGRAVLASISTLIATRHMAIAALRASKQPDYTNGVGAAMASADESHTQDWEPASIIVMTNLCAVSFMTFLDTIMGVPSFIASSMMLAYTCLSHRSFSPGTGQEHILEQVCRVRSSQVSADSGPRSTQIMSRNRQSSSFAEEICYA